MGFWITWKAVFYDDNGEQFTSCKFNPDKPNFRLKKVNKSFLIDLSNGFYFQKKGFIRNVRYYFYDVNHPHPLLRNNKKIESYIDSEMLNIQLENKVARDLNRLGDKKFSDLLTPKNIIFGLIILVAIWLLATGKLSNITG